MRLLNCFTLEFEEFLGLKTPPYAILSHTWGENEVTFSDYRSHQQLTPRSNSRGFEKILKFCNLALHDSYGYAWVDTCCIDKTSSAELSEAINSMYKWYADSKRCYVYLNDFDSKDPKCDLVTRGWTLQELIAPSDIHFYDEKWRYFANKSELGTTLSAITGIDILVLNGANPLHRISVAKRMSWAAKRTTTREEDLAYCLLGIFSITLPLVYGEGPRAFLRLQEEIIKETNDLTLFAWQAEVDTLLDTPYRGILAKSPLEFKTAKTITSNYSHKTNPEFAMTNKGLKIRTILRTGSDESVLISLNCHGGGGGEGTMCIYLVHIGEGVYARDMPHKLGLQPVNFTWEEKSIYITKDVKELRDL
ncbi:hypothetical protein HYFRA_00011274 [Hymenoscyphus fraxineus]|uniref:HET-domain-containing protein n=1 Tax=Hymenoscyphus fraxineus TaxID=746836 RepID=A0A9N9L0D4_9HELO|nr:hypothetical protein HYFRA_00011274 [Hymenoscyphus fraxineus]